MQLCTNLANINNNKKKKPRNWCSQEQLEMNKILHKW